MIAYASLALDSEGDLPDQPYIVEGEDGILQKLRIRFRFFKAEWFLDTRLGIPYREDIFVKNPNMVLVIYVLRKVVETTPGIAKVLDFTARLEENTRRLFVDFEAEMVGGNLLIVKQEPFIVIGSLPLTT